MNEEKHDPRHKDVGDQLPEEQHEGAAEGEGPAETGEHTRGDDEGDPQQATGNPRAAG
jgi:hypothetical protein